MREIIIYCTFTLIFVVISVVVLCCVFSVYFVKNDAIGQMGALSLPFPFLFFFLQI